MEYLEYTVFTKASPSLAWEMFCDYRLWPRFSNIYGDICWTKGKPWTAGSRLKIEIVRPKKATVDHVITVCSPAARQIAWIDHVLGNTMEQWVTFEVVPDGRTRVHTWADITTSAPFPSINFSDFVRGFIRQWYDSFCLACDQLADASTPPPDSPEGGQYGRWQGN